MFQDQYSGIHVPTFAKWDSLFDLFTSLAYGSNRLRTYWYVVQHIAYVPFDPYGEHNSPEDLEKVLLKNKKFEEELRGLTGEKRKEYVGKMLYRLQDKHRKQEALFRKWHKIYDQIERNNHAIEFGREGTIHCDLVRGNLFKEKAVDTNLSVDLLRLKDIYDVAILVSGDQDYIPPIRVIKNAGKRVVNILFEARGGKVLPGGSWRLNKLADGVHRVRYDQVEPFMNWPKKDAKIG